MLIQMTDEKGEQQILNIQTYKLKAYEPTGCIQKFSFMLIRPPRVLYNDDLLKPQKLHGKRFEYSVFYIPFPLSLYQPKNMDYVLLYLHGNASSRLQGMQELTNLPENVGLACFDFDGCGNRLQRGYISLGKKEAQEVDIAASYLRSKGYSVVGWGRSMGSVSALLSTECQVVVADSPYSSLRDLCYQKSEVIVPCLLRPCFHCLFPCFLCIIDTDIKRKTEISIKDLEIINLINHHKKRSILFLSGTEDALIDSKHARQLYERYEGPKKLLLFEGDHNSLRPPGVIVESHKWIQMMHAKERVQSQLLKSRTRQMNYRPLCSNKSLSQMRRMSECPTPSNNQELIIESTQKIGMSSLGEKVELMKKQVELPRLSKDT